MPEEDDGNLKDLGWRQGTALSPAQVTDLVGLGRPPTHEEDEVFVVASHDCDVTAESFEKEPRVEVARGAFVEGEPDGNYTHGKNPRVLHVPCFREGEETHVSFRAEDRLTFDRSRLRGGMPNDGFAMDAQAKRTFRNWLADRYSREAFADEFNRRIQPAMAKVEDKLKRKGRDLSGIYLLVRDDELPPETDYDIDIVGTMRSHHYDDVDLRETAESAIAVMEALLAKAEGVRVDRAVVVSERELSLADIRVLKRWDYDALSLRHDPADPVPPGR